MRMKKLWIVTGVIVVLGVVAGGVFFFVQKNTKVMSSGKAVVPMRTPTPAVALTTWDDPAGFSFQYPKDLSVNTHEDDNINYAHVELTNSNHPGGIIVWVSDLPKGVTDTVSWVTKNPAFAGAMVIDTTLGGQAAKKILIASPSAKFLVGTVTDSLLFYVDGTLSDKPYWQSVEDTIAKSFAFTPDTSAPTAQTSPGDAVDEEEVVQ
jgi:Flp pilus assembly protein CpaB